MMFVYPRPTLAELDRLLMPINRPEVDEEESCARICDVFRVPAPNRKPQTSNPRNMSKTMTSATSVRVRSLSRSFNRIDNPFRLKRNRSNLPK